MGRGDSPIDREIDRLKNLARSNWLKRTDGEAVFLSGYADASFNPADKRGGYGVWVRDHEKRVVAGGPCPEWAADSMLAEFWAVCRAVHVAMEKLDRTNANIVVIKSDCQAVVEWFRGERPRVAPRVVEAVVPEMVKVFTVMKWADLRLIVKWVKGHQGNRHGNGETNVQGWLNNHVDQIARRCRVSRETVLEVSRVDERARVPQSSG